MIENTIEVLTVIGPWAILYHAMFHAIVENPTMKESGTINSSRKNGKRHILAKRKI